MRIEILAKHAQRGRERPSDDHFSGIYHNKQRAVHSRTDKLFFFTYTRSLRNGSHISNIVERLVKKYFGNT